MLFAGVYVCTFQPETFMIWGSERVKTSRACAVSPPSVREWQGCLGFFDGGDIKWGHSRDGMSREP